MALFVLGDTHLSLGASKPMEFLQSRPGQKIIMKGNHDYWWSTVNKMNAYLKA